MIRAALAGLLLALLPQPAAAEVDPPLGRWATPHVRIHVPAPLPRWPLARAIRAWKAAGVITVTVTAAPCDGCITIRKGAAPEGGLARTYALDGTIVRCEVILDSVADPLYRLGIATHELGHCLGLGHAPAARSVMADPRVYRHVTPYDVAALTDLYASEPPS